MQEDQSLKIKILKKHGFIEDKTISAWINYNEQKIFKEDALENLDQETLKQKLGLRNDSGEWLIFSGKIDITLSEEDVRYMFGLTGDKI
ncbi:MAG: hypothetical protein ACMUIM_11755 [bacterium]